VKGHPLVDFNATHYAPQELAKSFDTQFSPFVSNLHPYQLRKSAETYLRIIHKGTGVGGFNSWGKTPLERYRINASDQSYTFHYTLRPIVNFNPDDASHSWSETSSLKASNEVHL